MHHITYTIPEFGSVLVLVLVRLGQSPAPDFSQPIPNLLTVAHIYPTFLPLLELFLTTHSTV